jgi:sugar O-acyltransferase (sialic acid O-acetyltransferase NeuD family)
MKKIIIYGNGKIAKIVYHFLKKSFNVVGFTVDKKYIQENSIEGLPLISFEEVQEKYNVNEYKMIIAVGYVQMNSVREKKYKEAKKKGYNFVNYIHPSVEIHENIKIGENNIILDHVAIQPYASIGNSNFLWSNATLAHGSSIEDTNWITSGVVISGDVTIKSKCFLGVNSAVGHNITIESENFIGANTLVTKNTCEKEVYISKEGKKIRLDTKRFLKFAEIYQ